MTTDFDSCTPANINDMAISDVLNYVHDREGSDLPTPRVRLNIVKMLYDVLGFTFTPDVALATIVEPQALLVLATAGGGKTTWAQVRAIMEKIIRKSVYHPKRKINGQEILCLVYNRHNVKDMKDKHHRMVKQLQVANIKGLNIDDDIHACTLHSFCDSWRKQFVYKMDLLGCTLLQEKQAESYMRRAISIAFAQVKQESKAKDVDAEKMYSFYMLYKESLVDSIHDLENSDRFADLHLESEMIERIFDRFEAAKKIHRKYDFVDMLVRFYNLLQTDPQALNEVQHSYEYVIADEVQDFTPLMWKILHLMVSDGTPLTCIGDEDQNIYSFRGANIENILKFSQEFTGGEVYSLEYNRRCRANILNEARRMIGLNSLRFNKKIIGTKDGGNVSYIPYNTVKGQNINIIKTLQDMSEDDLNSTVICYRESLSSVLLTDMLAEEDIIFNVISGVGAYEYELYRHVFNIFDALEMPTDMGVCTNLYKVLPCSKDSFYKAIGYNPANNSFKSEIDKRKHFINYDYGDLEKIKSFRASLETLKLLSDAISTTSVRKLIRPIFQLLSKYFWEFKKQVNNTPDIDNLMEERVFAYFDSDLLYSDFYREHVFKVGKYKRYTENRDGVTVSTFHSLKGLEFKNVIVICMDNDIFPNFGLIDSKKYAYDISLALKEAETRLWYVAITRAIDNLTVYYSKGNPSIYVRYALDNEFPTIAFSGDQSNVEQMTSELPDSVIEPTLEPEFLDFTAEFAEPMSGVTLEAEFAEPVESERVESVSGAESEFAEPVSGAESEFVEPVASEQVEPTEPEFAESSEPTEQVEQTKSTESVDSVEQTESNITDFSVTLKSGKSLYLNHLLENLA